MVGKVPPVIRIDLHLHSWGSWDCLSDPERILSRAERVGIHRIAITDHNRLAVSIEMHRKYPDRVIPGEEVRTREGIDLIGLYIRREIPGRTPAREVIRSVREDGGLVYLPHPFARGKGGGGRYARELAPMVDIVEVFNARLHPGRLNAPAEELAREKGRLRGAGSDAHTLGELGRAFVELPAHANEPGALLESLERGKIEGRTAPQWVHLASTWAKIRRALPGGSWRGA